MRIRTIHAFIYIMIMLAMMPSMAQAKIIAVSASCHVLALDDNGTVWAWGYNSYGQLGIGTAGGEYKAPQRVLIDNVKAISSNIGSSFALKKDGTVWAWGDGGQGRLGYGGNEDQSTPVQVKGLNNVVAIASDGGNGYALKSDGTVWSWGDNREGELGDGTYGTPEFVNVPVQVTGLTDIVALGEHGHFAIKSDGTVYAWGSNTMDVNPVTGNVTYGALGDPSGPGERPTPFQVQGVNSIRQITYQGYGPYTLYLKNDGTVWGWGYNSGGVLGDGTESRWVKTWVNSSNEWSLDMVWTWPPVQARITDVRQISTDFSVIALKNDGTVWVWGHYVEDSLYTGKPAPLVPVQVNGLGNVVEVNAGAHFDVALKDDGSVWGWGQNSYKSLGDDDPSAVKTSPVLLFQVSDHVAASPSQSPTETPIETPTPVSSVTATPVTSSPSQEPTGVSASNTPVSSDITRPTTMNTSAPSPLASGLVLELAGIAGLVLVAGVAVYLWVTRRL